MRLRIDLKILFFLILFYFTKQIKIYLIIMFFSFIHELGHLIIGLILKLKLEKLEILPYGVTVLFKINIQDLNKKIGKGNILELKKIVIALAGPIVSLIIALIYLNYDPIYLNKTDIIYSNILIAIFNLLPIYPLDGGRIINGILHIKYGNIKAQILTDKISYIMMIILTIISSIAVYYFKNIAIFLICIILWMIVLQVGIQNKKNNNIYER